MGDTIAAISTSTVYNSGIGIIRISGDSALKVASNVFVSASGKNIDDMDSYTASYGHIVDNSEVIDQVIILVMRGPKSYTTEDVVEIQCHGGSYICKRILEVVLSNGARLAKPGEFTQRAYLGGRIDLTQAEAVMDLIASKNEMTRKASVMQLEGRMGEQIRKIREEILENTALIESALDDPEHYDISEYSGQLNDNVDKIVDKLQKLWVSIDNGYIFKEGINTVILGKPNAGKSSLLNLLAKRDRSIVTDIEGTTRDIIEEQISLDGILLNLRDTAGIRKTEDYVENIGVNRAKEAAEAADLILYVVDSSKKLDNNDKDILDMIADKNSIILINKTDLDNKLSTEDFEYLKEKPLVYLSAKTGEGLDELTKVILEMFLNMTDTSTDNIYFANIRQKECLKKALDSMNLVKQTIADGMPEDCYTIDLMEAYENLGFIVGESLSDDLASKIFESFCMGK